MAEYIMEDKDLTKSQMKLTTRFSTPGSFSENPPCAAFFIILLHAYKS
jgi:hypothetical protein